MTDTRDDDLDDKVGRIMNGYLRSKGIDPDTLDDISEEEFRALCADAQIDAYLLGKLEANHGGT